VMTTAIRKWRHYLLGHPFTILTDHRSLKDLMSQVIQTPEQQYYLTKLLGYDYQIAYKPGTSNVVANALSRIDTDHDSTLLILSYPHFDFMTQLRQSLQSSPDFQQMRDSILRDPSAYPDYRIQDELIICKGSIWLDSRNPFIQTLLSEFHSTPLGGHLGVAKTLHRLQANFVWSSMRDDVKLFVRQCSTCQQLKHLTRRPAGLLQPLPVPTGIWEDLSLDFITHLPKSHGYTVILVVVDRFTKGVHLGALPAQFTASKVATLFFDIVCKIHGFPHSLVSDRDPVFVSAFWRELFKLSGTLLRLSTAYHPQTDGQTEVMNRVVQQYLRSFTHSRPSEWYQFLGLAEWSYNTSLHSSTGITPYEATFGKPPPSIPDYVFGSSRNEAIDSLLTNRQLIHASLTRRLLKAQTDMKKYADAKRRDAEFTVGQWVYVKLRPYRQGSVTKTTNQKLAKRYFGPFEVLERIGNVAYRLKLPADSRIHPVFHCSLLRPHSGPLPSHHHDLPPHAVGNQPLLEPLSIISSKMDMNTTPPTPLVLVQWVGLPPEEATWESWSTIRDTFHLEDKVVFPVGGIDSNHQNPTEDIPVPQGNNTPSEVETHNERPKRITKRPTYLEQYT